MKIRLIRIFLLNTIIIFSIGCITWKKDNKKITLLPVFRYINEKTDEKKEIDIIWPVFKYKKYPKNEEKINRFIPFYNFHTAEKASSYQFLGESLLNYIVLYSHFKYKTDDNNTPLEVYNITPLSIPYIINTEDSKIFSWANGIYNYADLKKAGSKIHYLFPVIYYAHKPEIKAYGLFPLGGVWGKKNYLKWYAIWPLFISGDKYFKFLFIPIYKKKQPIEEN